MPQDQPDPYVRELRDQIAELDRSLVRTLNARIELVARLKRYKDENGIAFLDRAREQSMLRLLAGENDGPLSQAGLAELYAFLLELTKRELPGGDP